MTLAVGIELGGTKTIVAGSLSGRDLIGRRRIPTTDPASTLAAVAAAIADLARTTPVISIGIGTFGPVDLRPGVPTHGTIMRTPKPGWSGVNLIDALAVENSVVSVVDTDVAAALVGERSFGAAGGAATAAYMTVGTGVGAAVWTEGGVLRGANHSEIGHVRVPRRVGDDFPGMCPYHQDCLEGMASGPALAARFGGRLEELDGADRSRAAELAAAYVGHGVFTLNAVVPTELVVVGGGVAKLPRFHELVAHAASTASAGYPPVPFAAGGPRVVPPDLADDAGVVGAIELGRGTAGGVAMHG